MYKYLINEPEGFSSEVIDLLDRNLFTRTFDPLHAEIVFIRFREKVDVNFLDRHNSLLYILTPTTGVCHVNMHACVERGIVVISLRDCKEYMDQIRSTSEFTILLILSTLRRFHQACSNQFNTSVRNRMIYRGADLCGKSVGIIGYGRIGSHVYEYLKAFKAQPIVWDTNTSKLESLPCSDVAESLEDLLRMSEILTLHVDINESSVGLVNARTLSLLPPRSFIVNSSRAHVVKKADLIAFIRNGHISAYASDVMWDESAPTLDEDLLKLANEGYNILLTPHMAGCTLTSMNKTELFVAQKLIHQLSGQCTI